MGNSSGALRERLSEVLDQVTPSSAPVAQVLQRAAAIRRARWVLAATGTAAIVAAVLVAAVVVPGSRLPSPQPRSKPTPPGGIVVGAGTVSGRPWHVVVNQARGELCASVVGLKPSCTALGPLERQGGLAALSGMSVQVPGSEKASFSLRLWNAFFGPVQAGVTRIAFRTSLGPTYELRPVRAAGYRWVGLVLPSQGVGQFWAVAYAGRTELGYSVPFIGGALRPGAYFVTWLPPGQPGPVEANKYIATGGSGASAWSALVLSGPWGYCVSLNVPVTNGAKQRCFAVGSLRGSAKVIMAWGSPPAVPRWIVGTARPDVAYLRLTMADGVVRRVAVSDVSGQSFYAIEIGPGPAEIVRWSAFDSKGRNLYGGTGAPDSAPQH